MQIPVQAQDPRSTPEASKTPGWPEALASLARLVERLAPREVVGLGLQPGQGEEAYFALCTQIATRGEASAFGIDIWQGETGAALRVPAALQLRNRPWQDRSGLICADPAATAGLFDPDTVDLLLLAPRDGAKTAGRWLGAWAPQLSDGGIAVLLLSDQPSDLPEGLTAMASGPLLVLAKGAMPAALADLLTPPPPAPESAPEPEVSPAPAGKIEGEVAPASAAQSAEPKAKDAALEAALEEARARAAVLEAELHSSQAQQAALEAELQAMVQRSAEMTEALHAAAAATPQPAPGPSSADDLAALEERHQAEILALTAAAAASQELMLAQRTELQQALRALDEGRPAQGAQDQRIAALLAQLIEAEARAGEQCQQLLAQERDAREQAEAARAALEQRLAAIYRSKSWRLTGPFRRLTRLMRPRS